MPGEARDGNTAETELRCGQGSDEEEREARGVVRETH